MADREDWRGDLGVKWARNAAVMERMLAPFGDEAMLALDPIAGRRILDLGCGGGATTLELARRIAPDGAATGLDVSPDLIALAERRLASAGIESGCASFLCADASTATFDAPFDAIYSQFGAMFFDQPVEAWSNLRRAAKPGAPLAIACWRAPRENEWAMLAVDAVKPILPPTPPADRLAPGPFAWSSPEDSFARILPEAGWRSVAWRPFERLVPLGAGYGEPGEDAAETATNFVVEMGPIAGRLATLDEDLRNDAIDAIASVMKERARGDAVPVTGAAWIVTAIA